MSKPLRVIKSLAVTDATLTATSVPEADHPVYSAVTTYGLADRVMSAHKIYESLQAGNVGKALATEPDWWVEVGATNRWAMFDLSSTTATVVDAADYYEFEPGVAVNAVGLVGINGLLTVRIRMTDPLYGVVYDQTADLNAVPSESSWYAWFFEPRTQQTLLVMSDLPSYPNAVLRIDMTSSGTASVGALVYGTQRTIGTGIKAGVRLGIQDYSRKERNDWGDTVLVQRAYSKRITFGMQLANDQLDNTYELLADMRATPCLWIGSDGLRSLSVFGFYSNFEIDIAYARFSDCSIDVEGLT